MNESQAYCPRCKKVAAFVKVAGTSKCQVCGFEYQLSEPPRLNEAAHSKAGAIGMLLIKIFGGILLGFLALAGIFALLMGIAFIGCLVSSNPKFGH